MKKSGLWMFVLVLLVVLSACTSAKPEGNAAPEQPAAKTAAFPRDVESAGGNVTIGKKPVKVGMASWQLLEMLFLFDQSSMGVTLPFAAANSALESEQYKPYVDKLSELKVVGENTQVNLEAMLAYGPDLILAGSNTNKDIKDQLEKIAPTVWIDETKINIRNEWPKVVTLLGNILGQEQRAQDIIADFTAKQHEGKTKLTARSGETVLFVQVREKAVYMMPPSSLTRYYEGLGLTAPQVKEMPANAALTLEGLSEINPDHLFLGYFNYTNKSLGALTDQWKDSEVWKSLKAVKNNRVYALNGELALGLGPIGQTYGIDTVVQAMK